MCGARRFWWRRSWSADRMTEPLDVLCPALRPHPGHQGVVNRLPSPRLEAQEELRAVLPGRLPYQTLNPGAKIQKGRAEKSYPTFATGGAQIDAGVKMPVGPAPAVPAGAYKCVQASPHARSVPRTLPGAAATISNLETRFDKENISSRRAADSSTGTKPCNAGHQTRNLRNPSGSRGDRAKFLAGFRACRNPPREGLPYFRSGERRRTPRRGKFWEALHEPRQGGIWSLCGCRCAPVVPGT